MESLNEIQSNHHIISTFEMNLVFLICDFFFFFLLSCIFGFFLLVFTQRVSRVLWSQLDTERREQHISCVELFCRLHCLAPSASICEDIICQALLHKDKVSVPADLLRCIFFFHIFTFLSLYDMLQFTSSSCKCARWTM